MARFPASHNIVTANLPQEISAQSKRGFPVRKIYITCYVCEYQDQCWKGQTPDEESHDNNRVPLLTANISFQPMQPSICNIRFHKTVVSIRLPQKHRYLLRFFATAGSLRGLHCETIILIKLLTN